MCFCSFSLPSELVGTVSARWFRALMTPSVCSSGWWDSNRKYWSLCAGFSVHLHVEASVERQTVSSNIFLRKLDVIVHSIYVFCEGFPYPRSDFDPGFIHIPEPVAGSCSFEGNQGSALSFFHVEVGHYWGVHRFMEWLPRGTVGYIMACHWLSSFPVFADVL